MKDVMALIKALADPNRTRVLLFLQRGELCLCQIMEMLRLAPSTVSKHLTILHQAGLVASRKDGRWIYYRLPGPSAGPAVRGALRWLREALAADEQVARDARNVKAVCRMKRDDLCGRYKH
ncbi:MAG: metalloregulator ArsR/SmtB family transcription factor [Planctomycetota bacterium]|nr:metalloregulator ArsR/SmtB family transcription factor [Planctomycetota bacterium]